MKRKMVSLTLALLTVLTMSISAAAAGADSFPASGETIGYVTDTSGVMTAEEREALSEQAQDVSEQYDFGVYVVTVPDFRAYTSSEDVFEAATTIYTEYEMGMGEDAQGVLLLLSTETRDYSLITHGDYGQFLFDETVRNTMIDGFIGDLGANRWYDAFAIYVSLAEGVLAEGPETVRATIVGMFGTIFTFPLLVAAIVVFFKGRKMKNVAYATEALEYSEEGMKLTNFYDLYTHTTESRRKKPKESSDSDRSNSSSGGFSGTSGKF